MEDDREAGSATATSDSRAETAESSAPTVRSDALAPGTKLGRYTIERLVGEGGMGAVYEAKHRDLGKRVAIKTLHRRLSGASSMRARFMREGQAAARIRHDHVVDVSDVGVERDIPYLVMEYLEGESLAALLEREKSLPVERIAAIMVPVAAALAVAHAQGVVHRDLKPENIFLCTSRSGPKPKVVDFGISKMAGADGAASITATSAMLGTPFYMSPEQAKDARSIDARTDQYSFGVILYQLATGQRPFEDESLYSLLDSIVKGQFDPPKLLVPELPGDFDALVRRAMANDPEDRFTSIADLGRALLGFADERTRILFANAFAAASVPPPPPASVDGTPSFSASSATVGGELQRSRRMTPFLIGAGVIALVVVAAFLSRGHAAPAPAASAALASAPASPATSASAAPKASAAPPEPVVTSSATAEPSASAPPVASAAPAASKVRKPKPAWRVHAVHPSVPKLAPR